MFCISKRSSMQLIFNFLISTPLATSLLFEIQLAENFATESVSGLRDGLHPLIKEPHHHSMGYIRTTPRVLVLNRPLAESE
jgi:hypothetical protein